VQILGEEAGLAMRVLGSTKTYPGALVLLPGRHREGVDGEDAIYDAVAAQGGIGGSEHTPTLSLANALRHSRDGGAGWCMIVRHACAIFGKGCASAQLKRTETHRATLRVY